MLIISIVDILAQLCLLIFSYFDKQGCSLNFSSECGNEPKINEDDLIFTVAINIIFRYIFSRLLLTVYIYPHHLISMIVTIISFIPLIIFNIITIYRGEQKSETYIYILLNILMTIIYAFEDIMNKITLNQALVRPYDLMFYKAVFQIPLFIVTITIVYLIDVNFKNKYTITLLDYILKNKSKWLNRLLYRLSFIISNIFRTLSLISIIEILSPNHLSILKSVEFVTLASLSLVKNLIYNKINKIENDTDNEFYIIELICCIFLMFASAIHNEIIIINRCNLAKETIYYKNYLQENDIIDNEIEKIEKIVKENETDFLFGNNINE